MENRFSRRFFTKVVTYFTLEVFVLQPMLVMADGIAVDVVTGNQNTAALMVGDVPIINIATPSAAGLSHNRFNQFNVGAPGAVMNNSASQVDSALAGQISGNSNLAAGNEARIILNEVTGGSRSALNGVTEIAGQQAEYILANPNGISCNGCGFINTPDVSLTTGTPHVNGGQLQSLSINDGTISFDGAGAYVPNVSNFNVLARAVEVNAKIQGSETGHLNILTGRNDYNVQTGELSAKADNGTAKPAFALDSAALGGMYAGAITLVGTENGVGVNMQGVDIAANAGALTISANGEVFIQDATAAETLTINAEQSDVTLSGTVYGGSSAVINAENTLTIEKQAAVASSAHIRATANTIEQHGQVIAGAQSDGSLSSDTLSWFTAQGVVVNTGTMQAGTVVVEAGTDINNTDGVVIADQLVLDSGEAIINQHGSVQSGTSLVIGAGSVNNQDGSIVASGTASIITTGDVDNSFGSMILDGTEHIDIQRIENAAEGETPELTKAVDTSLLIGGQFNNTEGVLLHTSTKTLSLSAKGGIDNTDGKLGSAGIMALATEGQLTNTFGDIAATAIGGAFGSLDNGDGVIESGTLAIQITDSANNAYGLISALANVHDALFLTVGESFDNSNGAVISNAQSSSLFTGSISNTGGLISNAGEGSLLVVADQHINNNAGDLIANGQLDVWGGSVSNVGGGINAGGFLDVLAEGELDNSAGFIEANDGLLIDVASVQNGDGIISNLGFANALITTSGDLANQAGLIQSRGDNLDIDALNLHNQAGVISHSGEGWLTIYGNLQNQKGEILSNGSVDFVGDSLINELGSIKTLGDIYAWANEGISNVQGTIDSKGTVDLIAGAAGINNREGSILSAAASNAYLDAEGDINNTDGVVYSNANALMVSSSAGNIINNGGDILHAGEGELHVIGNNIGNIAGRMLGNGNADIQARDQLLNTDGQITAQQLRVAARQIDNTDNSLIYGQDTLALDAAILNNHNSTVGAVNGLVLTLDQIDNTNGILRSDNLLELTLLSGDIASVGGVISAAHNTIHFDGDYVVAEGGQYVTSDSLTFNITGNLINDGTISTEGNFTANGQDLINGESAVLSAGLNNQLNFTNILNLGRISAGQDLKMVATNIDNYGVLAAQNNVAAVVLENFSNSDFMFAGNSMELIVNEQFNNLRNGSVFAMGDLMLFALPNDQGEMAVAKVLNESGSIESYNGRMMIIADQLINKREHYVVEQTGVITTDQRITTDCSSGACLYAIEETVGPKTLEDSPAARIQSGGDMALFVNTVDNAHSIIAAGDDLVLTGDSFNNEALDLAQIERTSRYDVSSLSKEVQTAVAAEIAAHNAQFDATLIIDGNGIHLEVPMLDIYYNYFTIWADAGYTYEVKQNGDVPPSAIPASLQALTPVSSTETRRSGRSSSVMQAGGRFTANLTGSLNNVAVEENATDLLIDIQTANTDTAGLDLADIQVSEVEALAAGDSSSQQLAQLQQQAAADRATIDVAAQKTALALASYNPMAKGISLPKGNGLFRLVDDLSTGTVIEANALYIDGSESLSTDYLLANTSPNANASSRRLGDGFYESRLIRDAIFYGSGRRFLDGFTDDQSQFQHLMDNAIAQQGSLGLTIGEALTATQVKQLDSSIVWLVEQDIHGVRALVPVYYAAGEDRKQSAANLVAKRLDIQTNGDLNNQQVISGNSLLRLATDGNLSNSGDVSSGGDVALNAGESINNTADVSAGGDLSLIATGDITNSGANLDSGGDINLHAIEGNVTVTAEVDETITDLSYELGEGVISVDYITTRREVGDASTLNATGNIILSAAGDASVLASDLTAGGDIALSAGGSASLDELVEEDTTFIETTFHYCDEGQCESYSLGENLIGTTNSEGSSATAGGTISISAGDGDASVIGSALAAGANNENPATGNILVTSIAGDAFIQGALNSHFGTETWESSQLNASGNITVQGQSADIDGSQLTAGSNINLSATGAEGKLSLSGAIASSTVYGSSYWRKENLQTHTATTLDAGGDISLQSQNNLSVDAVQANAGGDLALQAGGSLTIGTETLHEKADWRLYIGRGRTVSKGTESTINIISDFTAGGDISLLAGELLQLSGTHLNTGGNASLSGANIDITAVANTDSWYNHYRGRKTRRDKGGENTIWQLADIQAAGDISIDAAGDTTLEGVNLNAGGDATINAGGTVKLYAVADERSTYYLKRKERKWGRKSKRTKNTNTITQQGTALTGDNITVVSGTAPEIDGESGEILNGDIHIVGSSLTAEGNIDLNAGRDLILEAAANHYYEKTTHKRSGGSFGGAFSSAQTNRKGKGQSETTQVTHISSVLSAGDNISLQARRNIILQAARVQAGDTISLNALAGGIAMLVATDIDSYSMEKEGTSVGWVSGEGEGHYDETVRMTEIAAGNVIMNALNGITVEHLGQEGEDYTKQDVLEATLDQLAEENPAYGYLKQLKDRDDVAWQAVVEAHEEWDYDYESMSEVATAVVIIVVTVLTAGTGTGFVAAAKGAAATTLYSTAAVSVINNQGDLGAVLDEMASSDTIKKVVTSAVTAGALSYAGAATGVDMDISSAGFDAEGIKTITLNAGVSAGVDTAINGGSLSDNFGNALVSNTVTFVGAKASQGLATAGENQTLNDAGRLFGNTVIGCALGELQNDDCKGGAAGSFTSQLITEFYHDRKVAQLNNDDSSYSEFKHVGDAIAQVAGGLAATAVGGEFSTGQMTGAHVFQNDVAMHDRVQKAKYAVFMDSGEELLAPENQELGEAGQRWVAGIMASNGLSGEEANALIQGDDILYDLIAQVEAVEYVLANQGLTGQAALAQSLEEQTGNLSSEQVVASGEVHFDGDLKDIQENGEIDEVLVVGGMPSQLPQESALIVAGEIGQYIGELQASGDPKAQVLAETIEFAMSGGGVGYIVGKTFEAALQNEAVAETLSEALAPVGEAMDMVANTGASLVSRADDSASEFGAEAETTELHQLKKDGVMLATLFVPGASAILKRFGKGGAPEGGNTPGISQSGGERLFWGSWGDYPKVVRDGPRGPQEYAVIGDRLYSQHAVARMQPSGQRYSSGPPVEGQAPALSGNQLPYVNQPGIQVFDGNRNIRGRSISPNHVEDVIQNSTPVVRGDRISYTSGSVEVITSSEGRVITVISRGD